MEVLPTKQTIQESFLSASTRRTYATYQRQFTTYCATVKDGIDPLTSSTEECTDFFHHLYALGKSSRTIDPAKTALVALFKQNQIIPNPAQDIKTKQYVVGLQKYNRQNNIDDERKAHALTVNELSLLFEFIGKVQSLPRRYVSPLVLFRIYWLHSDGRIACFKVERRRIWLRWHKKASVQRECQVYHLVDEESYPCLRFCGFYNDYVDKVRACNISMDKDIFVFPHFTKLHDGSIKLDWFKPVDQKQLRLQLDILVAASPGLPYGISLHSMRRGGCYYRVFVSPERRFTFRELMAWCRWADAKTCCEYLVTRNLSDEIDPTKLLTMKENRHVVVDCCPNCGPYNFEKLLQILAKFPPKRQKTLDEFVVSKSIPTAKNAEDAWKQ
ncbi:hypothetical protein AeRB84_020112, partial [Aphanomyces euteiches]